LLRTVAKDDALFEVVAKDGVLLKALAKDDALFEVVAPEDTTIT
jgi:hypothetical protein